MELNEVMYYIVDKNDRFVSCDYEAYMLYASNHIDSESCNSKEHARAKEMCFSLEQEYLNGEVGKTNVKFPLRTVKVTTSHIVEEME